jgi:hypothetical protein
VKDDWKEAYDAAKGYNVVLYLYGHTGTGLRAWAPDGETRKWDCINNGHTDVGFFVIHLTDTRLRAAYRAKAGLKFTRTPGGPTKHEWGGEWEWRLPFERKLK